MRVDTAQIYNNTVEPDDQDDQDEPLRQQRQIALASLLFSVVAHATIVCIRIPTKHNLSLPT